MRANWLSNRVFESYDAIIDAACGLGETSSPNRKPLAQSACATGRISVNHKGRWCYTISLRSRTPGPPPFSAMNSTPAAPMAAVAAQGWPAVERATAANPSPSRRLFDDAGVLREQGEPHARRAFGRATPLLPVAQPAERDAETRAA